MDKYKDLPLLKYRYEQPKSDPINTSDIWHTSFGGVPLIQAWQDLMLWENFLNEVDPCALWEIGTFTGGLSLFLNFQMMMRGSDFRTFDIVKLWNDQDWATKSAGLNEVFFEMNVFSPDFKQMLAWLLKGADNLAAGGSKRPTSIMLFCDGGNKPLEMQTFTPLLRSGDFLAVHDWGNEIADPDLASVAHLLEPFMQKDCEDLHSLTRFFRRK